MKIVNCSCKSEYQDQKYGNGKRTANETMSDGKCVCTVCGKTVLTK